MMRGRGRDDECAYRPQLPLALADDSEPEPDAAVVEGDVERYRHEHPRHPVLVVEVADATLAFDRSRKAIMYATAGVPEYWIVNLLEGVLEVFREPGAAGYASHRRLGADETISLAAPGRQVPVGDLLP